MGCVLDVNKCAETNAVILKQDTNSGAMSKDLDLKKKKHWAGLVETKAHFRRNKFIYVQKNLAKVLLLHKLQTSVCVCGVHPPSTPTTSCGGCESVLCVFYVVLYSF